MNQNDYQSKNYAFTWNNYQETQDWSTIIETFARNNCEFVCYAEEKAPTTGIQHLQGYISLKGKKRLSTLKNMLNKEIHFERARKCKLANYRYCTKEGKAWVYDSMTNYCGIIDKSEQPNLIKKHNIQKRTLTERLNHCINLAKSGKMEEILTTYPDIYLKYKDKLDAIRLDTTKVERMYLNNEYGNFFKCHFLWLWGPTGTGKSYFCNILVMLLSAFMQAWAKTFNIEQQPLKVYYKNKNKYWDRYNNEEIVIVEEASPETMKLSAHYYKQWIDEYPFNPEIKGATINYIRPKFFIITSNYSLRQCFTDPITGSIKMEDYEPLSRRLCEYHLTKKENPNWPNYNDLTIYLNTLKRVKLNHFKNIELLINNIISNHNFKLGYIETNTTSSNQLKHNGHILIYECDQCDNDQFDCKHYEKDTKTFCHFCSGNCTCGRLDNLNTEHLGPFSKKQKTKPFTEEEIIDIENNTELNELKRQNAFLEDFTEPPSEITEPSQEDNIITLMMITDIQYNTRHEIGCIKCFKKLNVNELNLFCKDCATPKEFNKENGTIKCNKCKKTFTCLIDAHCPECTQFYKQKYTNWASDRGFYDNKEESGEDWSDSNNDVKNTNKQRFDNNKSKENKIFNKWLTWTDTKITPNIYNIENQIIWLNNNLYKDNKNFYYFTKNHKDIPSLLMIRQSLKEEMSKTMTNQKYYEKKYDPKIFDKFLTDYLNLNKDKLLEKNSIYYNKIYFYKYKFKELQHKFFYIRKLLLNLDDNLKLKAFRNKKDLIDYFNHNNYEYITITYYEKNTLDLIE